MKSHLLHQLVGEIVTEKFGKQPGVIVKRDFACCAKEEPQEQLPLFSTQRKSRVTQLCKVDMLIIAENEVKIIIEIEESGMIPTKICGKFLTSGLAQWYIPYKGDPVRLADNLLFIQVLSSSKIPERSSIHNQWSSIESTLKGINMVGKRKMSYQLISGRPEDFKGLPKGILVENIRDFLRGGRI
jgi:hypothetical protein